MNKKSNKKRDENQKLKIIFSNKKKRGKNINLYKKWKSLEKYSIVVASVSVQSILHLVGTTTSAKSRKK